MNIYDNVDLVRALQKEIPILTAEIQALYRDLDRKFHLNGSKVPLTFGLETDLLGSYTRASEDEPEHFHFSLLFVGRSVERPLEKEDRMDLYKHEYAHYMQYHMTIPKEYLWQPGTHGSAWKYCCSLVGAVPTPYYRAGEALLKPDYEKVLKQKIHDKSIPIRDNYRREKEYQAQKNREIQFQVGEEIQHPKFGNGVIEGIEQMSGSVRLAIRFGNEVKAIDQKWLLRTRYKKIGSR